MSSKTLDPKDATTEDQQSTETPAVAAGKKHSEDRAGEAAIDEFGREGMGVAPKE